MFYLIGLGLDVKGISLNGLEAIKKCEKIYLENYTIDLPYKIHELEKLISKKIISVGRDFVENNACKLVKEAKKENIALLIYGSPLIATTHISLVQEAKKSKIKYEIIHNSSVLDSVTETGLQIYKFGKIASMPEWKKNFMPESFIEIVRENQEINAHTLILIDIGLEIKDALKQLEISANPNKSKDFLDSEIAEQFRTKQKLEKILVCQALGTDNKKIFYGKISKLKNKKIKKPYCIIIPSKLHFLEKEFLENF